MQIYIAVDLERSGCYIPDATCLRFGDWTFFLQIGDLFVFL